MRRLWGMGPKPKPPMPLTPPRFHLGDVVRHKISGERGAVVGIDQAALDDPPTWVYELGLSFKDHTNASCGEGELELDPVESGKAVAASDPHVDSNAGNLSTRDENS